MSLDINCYSHGGGSPQYIDAIRWVYKDIFAGVLCDGMANGAKASEYCSAMLLDKVSAGTPPQEAFFETKRAYEQAFSPNQPESGTSATIMAVNEKSCDWLSLGNSRLYHFSNSKLNFVTSDSTSAYEDYSSGAFSYCRIRSAKNRAKLTGGIGLDDSVEPTAGHIELEDGDGLLLCSDGFWQYIYEHEMERDFLYSSDAKDWLTGMMVKVSTRSSLKGDNLSALTLIYTKEKQNEG